MTDPKEEIFQLGLKLRWDESMCRAMPILRRKWYVDRCIKQNEYEAKLVKQK